MITTIIAVIATLLATTIIFKNSLSGLPSPWWSKLMMPFSVITAYVANVTHWGTFSNTFLAGFVFVVLGDIFFAFDKNNKNFVYGLASFAVAYVLFSLAFITGIGKLTSTILFVAPAVYAMVAILYFKGLDFTKDTSMKIPVAAYTFIVATMVVASTVTGNVQVIAGAFLAMYCDVSIGLDSFGKDKLVYRDNFVFVPYNIGHLILMLALLPLL